MGAFECIERLYEARRSLTLFTLVVNLCFGMAFSITTFNVVGRCVTEPCVAETAGLLRINSGTTSVRTVSLAKSPTVPSKTP